MLECQSRYIVSAIKTLKKSRARFMNVRADGKREFNDESKRSLRRLSRREDDCHTYFRIATGKVTTNWPGYATEYRWRTRAVKERDFEFVGTAMANA